MHSEVMTGNSSEAAAAAFVYSYDQISADVAILSICLEDGSVGIYKTDGSKMVEPLVAKSTSFDEVTIARGLDKSLGLAMDTMESVGYEALALDWRSHDRALQRFERSGGAIDGICLSINEEGVGRKVSASEWIRAFDEVVSTALAEAMEVVDGMLQAISHSVDETVVIIAGHCVDWECMRFIREHFGSDTRLTSDHRFPQGMGDGSAATLVQRGKELLESGAVRRDRRIPISISIVYLYGGDQSEDRYIPSIQLVKKGETVSALADSKWIGPIFGRMGDKLSIGFDNNDPPLNVPIPEELFCQSGFASFWVSAIVSDESILLGMKTNDASVSIMADGFAFPLKER